MTQSDYGWLLGTLIVVAAVIIYQLGKLIELADDRFRAISRLIDETNAHSQLLDGIHGKLTDLEEQLGELPTAIADAAAVRKRIDERPANW